jgi:hypothetical protein
VRLNMRPGRFPKVNDVILAEALRQLIPVAETGVRVSMSHNAVMAFRRAEMMLDMWTRQERGRIKKLGGPLPAIVRLEGVLGEDPNNPDPGQMIPKECERPKPIRKKAAPRPLVLMDVVTDWQLCNVRRDHEGMRDGSDEWNGICHLPTWTYFKINGDEAEIVIQGVLSDSRMKESLKKLAVKRFQSCQVSYRPDHRVAVKRGRQYVM